MHLFYLQAAHHSFHLEINHRKTFQGQIRDLKRKKRKTTFATYLVNVCRKAQNINFMYKLN